MTGPAAKHIKFYGMAALSGVVSAALAVFTLAPAANLVDLFDDLAATPFFIVALIPLLSAGLTAGPLGCVVAGLVALAGAALVLHPSTVGFFALADIVPALAAAFLVWRARFQILIVPARANGSAIASPVVDPEGSWLAFLAIYAAAIYLTIFGLTMGTEGGLTGLIIQAMNSNADQALASFHTMQKEDVPADTVAAMRHAIPQIAPVVPALIAASWLLMNVFAIAVAQRLSLRKMPLSRPIFAFNAMRAPGWVIFLTAGAGLSAALTHQPFSVMGANLALIAGLPYFFVGLAVIHAWAARASMPRLLLAAFYIIISLMPYLAPFVALLGLVDEWVDFRKRPDPDATHPRI